MTLPFLRTSTLDDRNILLTSVGLEFDDVGTLDSTNTDAGSTPVTRFRKGNVVVLDTATGVFHEANDAGAGDRNTAPAITSSGHVDGNGVIAVDGKNGLISVTTTTGAGTEANHVTDLNADATFAAHYFASSAASELTITALKSGADEHFFIDASTLDTVGFTEGVAGESLGADARYAVTWQTVRLVDIDGVAKDEETALVRRGHFDESQLINLTGEAKQVLSGNGSIFG